MIYLCEDKKLIEQEFSRLGFERDGRWRISDINKDFELCNTYPRFLIIPASFKDEELEAVAKFRYFRRIPVAVWRHIKNGCFIARSSQPTVGWFGWFRSDMDEALLHHFIINTTPPNKNKQQDITQTDTDWQLKNDNDDPKLNDNITDLADEPDHDNSITEYETTSATENQEELDMSSKLLVIDARSYAAAMANRAKGGGCEHSEYYERCEIQFMDLANIHSIRRSFQSLRPACETYSQQSNDWMNHLETSRWLHHISALIKSAILIVDTLDIHRKSILIHCSDGWDRTPQLVALAQLMLDSHYRTIDGFKLLVKREWLDFGHKFADRCGSNSDPNEKCPVFLQWLDCVHQMINQYPKHFEFNYLYLEKLNRHTYSNVFSTFSHNSTQERIASRIGDRLPSLWDYLEVSKNRFINQQYCPSRDIIRPSYKVKDLKFWHDVYKVFQCPNDSSITENE